MSDPAAPDPSPERSAEPSADARPTRPGGGRPEPGRAGPAAAPEDAALKDSEAPADASGPEGSENAEDPQVPGGTGPGGDEPGPAAAPSPALPALPITFRPTRTRVVLLTSGAVLFVLILAIVLMLPTLSASERTNFGFTALLFLAVPVLLSRPRVTAERHGVTVVNLTSRRRLEWAEILGVNLRAGDPWVFLDLADGTSLPAMGIQPGIAKAQAIRDARALRALVEAYGSADEGR